MTTSLHHELGHAPMTTSLHHELGHAPMTTSLHHDFERRYFGVGSSAQRLGTSMATPLEHGTWAPPWPRRWSMAPGHLHGHAAGAWHPGTSMATPLEHGTWAPPWPRCWSWVRIPVNVTAVSDNVTGDSGERDRGSVLRVF
jgi:hypothetical protein